MKWIICNPVLWLLLAIALLVYAATIGNPSQAKQLAAMSRAKELHDNLVCKMLPCSYQHRELRR
jgi:hypothetical protein